MRSKTRWTCVAVLSLMLAGASAQPAQRKEAPDQSSGGKALTPTLVKTGLYVISGGGCNSLLRLSANGFVLVDGKLPGTYEAILHLAKKLSYSEQPIRILINTDYHESHTGNNANFLEDGAAIIAQENVKDHLVHHNAPGGNLAATTKTFDHDFTIKLGGIEAQLFHFGSAHTSGDTVVYFPNLRVVAVGDLFAPQPNPDFGAGGSLVGWGPVLDEILKLDFDVAVPGTGPMISRADLQAFRSKIDTLVSRAAALVKRGVPKSRLMAELETDDLGWRFSFTGQRLDRFYAEMAGSKQPTVASPF
jgi:cyclase